jgi:CRP/FNR family transcriptional regulator, anaerobic regulatory protein
MKTTGIVGARHIGLPQDASVSYLHSAAQPPARRAQPSRLQQALRQVDELTRALASSRHELVAAREQVTVLSDANTQLRGLEGQFDSARAVTPCSAEELTHFSLSEGLDAHEMFHVQCLLTKRIRYRKEHVIYRSGDEFDTLYAIRAGSCKTILLGRNGQEQVTGYHMSGEIIGMDGIGSNIHECEATALEDMEVWPLPFVQIENLARCSDRFQNNLHKLLSQECSRVRTLMLVLGTMRAGERVAVFLCDLSRRYRARGFSMCELVLRMTRQEIGSYLGLKLETVSRQLARFQREGLIRMEGRTVKLLDLVALSQLAGCETHS